MNLNQVAKNPYFQAILFQVEGRIVKADNQADKEGIALNDSQINSALIKAIALVKGKKPKIEEGTPRDLVVAGLIRDLVHYQKNTPSGEAKSPQPIPAKDWVLAMEQVKDSVKRHGGGASGSRAYLEFIKNFVPDPEL